jgi:Cu/Ag efflux protein CusF
MSAIVDEIDVATRKVTLRTADGKRTTLTVGPEVKNLAQVRTGDEVTVGYLEAVAIQVRKPGEGKLGAVAAEELETAAPGEKPGAVAAQAVQITAKIVAIDREGKTVTLEGKDGTQVTLDVRYPGHFDAIAVGDLVEITYTESMAISVEATKK